LKRQLQRDRRRFFRAAKNVVSTEDVSHSGVDDSSSARTSDDDAPLAPISNRTQETRLIVRNTFFDGDTSGSEEDELEVSELPTAEFGATDEFEEFRRAYRRFRLGYHRGAKGEASAPKRNFECLILAPLEQSDDTSVSDECSDTCTPADSEEGEQHAQQLPARALKRQRQRERRRFFRAENKAKTAVQDSARPVELQPML
jgi:hypothetical protein